jgi:hypothetical protein
VQQARQFPNYSIVRFTEPDNYLGGHMPSALSVSEYSLADVVPIGRHPKLLPPGAEARHATQGWVLIEEARDNERLVRWYQFRNLPPASFFSHVDDEGYPIVEEQEITTRREWVSVTSLRRVSNPECSRPEDWQRLKRVGALDLPLGVVPRYTGAGRGAVQTSEITR